MATAHGSATRHQGTSRRGRLAIAAVVACATALTASCRAEAANPGPDADIVVFTTSPASAQVCWVLAFCVAQAPLSPQPFAFASLSCTFASVAENGVPDAETGPCSVSSTGTFENVVCGTGVVNGSATTFSEPGSDVYTVPGYTIVVASGVGVLVATGVTEQAGDDVAPGVAAGVVLLIPSALQLPPQLPNGTCTTGFAVDAVIATNA